MPFLLLMLLSAVPVQITEGPGNDTEAAWSPCGKWIAFQSDRALDSDLYLYDVATGESSALVEGEGHACFPAWSPDSSKIVYAYAHFTRTAAEEMENGYNLFTVSRTGGAPKRLTQGLHRDYTPCFDREGEFVYYASTMGAKKNSVGLFRFGDTMEPLLVHDSQDIACVQPDLSPDGRFIAYGHLHGFRDNWSIRLSRLNSPEEIFDLTQPKFPFYGPRWSPDGACIACTGYERGDPGWGIYLIDVQTARRVRLETGPGNARSPSWSPEGNEIVFENNRTGTYNLYRMGIPDIQFPPSEEEKEEGGPPLLHMSPVKEPVSVPNAKGCDFGTGPFTVRATVRIQEHKNALQIIVVGDYPGSRQGWQLYVSDNNHVYFNSRTQEGTFVGAQSDAPLNLGKKVSLVGLRRPSGHVELYVDRVKQNLRRGGAWMSYPMPNQIRIGSQYHGGQVFEGEILLLEMYDRALTDGEIGCETLEEFLSR